jgi:uncharacterized membrane protein
MGSEENKKPMEQDKGQLVPTSAVLAAAILGIVAANHFVVRAFPALIALDPFGLIQLMAVGVCMAIAWGLLTLRKWAWLAAMTLAGVGCFFPLVMMQDLQSFQLQAGFPGHTLVIQFLLFIEMASFSVFILLMTENVRDAFNDHRPERNTNREEYPASATATQTVHG